MTNSILITGATGTTGGAVLEALSAQNIPAKALVRNVENAAHLASDTVELVQGDLADSVSLASAMEGVKTTYLNIVPSPDALQQVDNFINAARSAGVQHIVKLSGLHASSDSRSGIIRLHAEADRRLRESGIGYTVLRANSFYQNLLGQLDTIKENGQFYLPLGDAKQSFIDVGDIAEIAVKRLTDKPVENADFDITGPDSLSLNDVAEVFSQVLGSNVQYVPISSDAFKGSLLEAGLPETAAESVAELFSVFAEGGYAEPTNDVAEVLGRAPRSIREFAQAVIT